MYAAQKADAKQQRQRQHSLQLAQRRQAARRLQTAAHQARVDAAGAQAKEGAWQHFYQPSKQCDSPPAWDIQVECGNAYVRETTNFETPWSRGGIPQYSFAYVFATAPLMTALAWDHGNTD